MRKDRHRIFFFFLALLIGGCSAHPSIVGTWQNKNQDGTTIRIKFLSNSRFEITSEAGHTPESWGTFGLSGNEITLQTTGSRQAGFCTQTGTYSYTLGDRKLSLEPVNDPCSERISLLKRMWEHVEEFVNIVFFPALQSTI